jgi:predicted RNA-binding protein with PIN domain
MTSLNAQALLLVDGYNIIGAWSALKRIRESHGLEFARRELIESLINYSAVKGLDTQIVFDAHYQNSPLSIERHSSNLSVHYTAFSQTADSYIEKLCATHSRRFSERNSRLIVATSDRDQRLTAVGYGAEWMSAQVLASDVEHTAQAFRPKKRISKRSPRASLFHGLDPKAQKQLQEWRRGIF